MSKSDLTLAWAGITVAMLAYWLTGSKIVALIVAPIAAMSFYILYQWYQVVQEERLEKMKPRTVGELLKQAKLKLSSGAYSKLGIAIDHLDLPDYQQLDSQTREVIRQKMFSIGEGSGFGALLDAFSSSTGNPVEEALKYIESL